MRTFLRRTSRAACRCMTLASLALFLPLAACAAEPTDAADGLLAGVSVHMSEASDGPTREVTSSGEYLAPGESAVLFLGTGFPAWQRDPAGPAAFGEPDSGPPSCSAWTGTGPEHVKPAGPVVTWEIEVTLEGLEGDRFDLAYRWARHYADETGEWRETASGEKKIELRHGERRALDFTDFEAPEGFWCQTDTMLLEIGVNLAGPQEYASRPVGFDLWLMHTVPGESGPTEVSSKVELSGRQGEDLPFRFTPWSMDFPHSDESLSTELAARIEGKILSWWVSREELLVIVDTRSALETRSKDNSGATTSSGGGIKHLRLEEGEVVEVVIPPHRGKVLLWGAELPDPLPAGFHREENGLVAASEELFAGHRFALRLQTGDDE